MSIALSTIKRKINMSASHDALVNLFETYLKDNEKFVAKGNKVAGTRARKALAEFAKVAKDRRKEIQDAKNAE